MGGVLSMAFIPTDIVTAIHGRRAPPLPVEGRGTVIIIVAVTVTVTVARRARCYAWLPCRRGMHLVSKNKN